MNVRCAFLNGKPDKELFILWPKGCTENKSASIFKLNHSLYGLKQSPQCWHKELLKSLIEIGLSPTETDPCLYHSKDPDKKMCLFIHVDNLIFGGSWNIELKKKITTYFDMEDLRCIKYALGIQITQENEYISLIKDKFISSILEKFGLEKSRPANNPLPGNIKSFQSLPCKEMDPAPFNY
ncbi:hypothetical protein O181_075963 [Austropuccinia psidii MF-1]|uniref:Reverse transcriptase Ty1/copia-type domain-containing protein n=1 Tax=Austropuccinia psidii MF-1 TaxID=1389203 RepID=A0A9Q3FE13_9BASI|nr:hypothetical protein [Austropuccinia psidii MF-1]